MTYECIPLVGGKPGVTLSAYIPDGWGAPRDAVLVIPGGAYRSIAADREGEPIALRLAGAGMCAFVLRYTVGEGPLGEQPLIEASLAMRFIRENAARYQIDAGRVFAMGFSAGGHLAGSLGTLWHLRGVQAALGAQENRTEINRPTGIVLCYAVVTMMEKTEPTTCRSLTGGDATLRAQFSLERHVDELSAPAFIMHTAPDPGVPVENALCMAQAYARAGMPFEMHIYPRGRHGMALADESTWHGEPEWLDEDVAKWFDCALQWMKKCGSR